MEINYLEIRNKKKGMGEKKPKAENVEMRGKMWSVCVWAEVDFGNLRAISQQASRNMLSTGVVIESYIRKI